MNGARVTHGDPSAPLDPVWGLVPRGPVPRWKRWVKRGLARTLSIGGSPADPGRGVAILAYHGTSDRRSDPWWLDFAGQMALLDDLGYQVVSLADAVERIRAGRTPERPTVALTFDDGYVNNLDGAFRELHRRGWPASVFVATSFVDRRPYMRASELRALAGLGIEVGNHTHSHLNLRGRSRERVRDEIETCQRRLEDIVGYRPRYFVYPDGGYAPEVCETIRACGLEAACTGRVGFNRPGTDPFRLRRLTLERGEGASDLEVRLRGGYDLFDLRLRHLDRSA